jgi:hypothetical protein
MSNTAAAGEEVPTFELGDRVYIEGGQLDKTRGRIYYMDSELIRILPDGLSDRVVDIPLEDGGLAESLGVESFYLLSKAASPAFVAQIDAQVDQIAETFAADGTPGIRYRIREINEGEDTMVMEDETGGRKELHFRSEFHRGIERSEEPLVVLRPRYEASPEEGVAEGNGAVANGSEEDGFGEFENIDVPAAAEEVEEEFAGLTLISAEDRTYPDAVQRNEMITSLLELLDENVQKLPRRQREIRQLSEQLLLLRNEVVKYTAAGDPDGQLTTSFQTIAELLNKVDIPLARPVLNVDKSLFIIPPPVDAAAPAVAGTKSVDIHLQHETIQAENNFLLTHLGGTAVQGQVAGALPAWYLTWEAFFRKYMRTFISGEGAAGQAILFGGDKEFFRAPVPKSEEVLADGLPSDMEAKKFTSVDSITSVRPSILKGLGPRETRLKASEPPVRIESGEEGVLVNQLLFPLSVERDLGATRSGSLAKDLANSHRPFKTIREIMTELDWIPDEPSAGNILSVGVDGNTEGNIGIEDWLKAQPLTIKGLGDARVQTKSLGITQRELNADQQEVLVDKIKSFRAAIKQHIKENIEESKKEVLALRLQTDTFLQEEALEELMAVLSAEPLLAMKKEELAQKLPAYKASDIAIVAGIAAEMADLMFAALAGEPGPLARERNRRVRDQFLEALRNAMKKKLNNEMAGEIPTPNTCPHVKDLESIRRLENEQERMALLSGFLTNYKKGREGNWVMCNTCDRTLLCYHEELLLIEYRHPREREVVRKELLLEFSRGQSGGHYMCKNCGQSMAEIDYDRGMEFNENGVPMAATAAALATEEKTSEEKALDEVLGTEEGVVKGLNPTDTQKMTDQQKIIYAAAAKIFERLGIYPDPKAYAGIIKRVEAEILKQPSRDQYAAMARARAAKGEKIADYDVKINQILVAATGVHVVIEIQTHVPDYVPRHTIPGCVAGFTGYPLGNAEDKTCINYVACAISGIKDMTAPWSLTGFQTIAADKRRQEVISNYLVGITAEALKTSAVQVMLTEKRVYYEKRYGSVEGAGALVETIPPGFRPVPYAIKPEEAAKAMVVPDAAGDREKAQAWIQEGHKLARLNGVYIKDTPYSETSCCTTTVSNPRSFWKGKEGSLPTLPTKLGPVGQHDSQVMFRYTPRPITRILATTPEDLLYRVYLKVCYDGPRKGLPHEPGYTNVCPHCAFQFPESPYTESPAPPLSSDSGRGKEMMKEWRAEMDAIITRGKAALESQRVPVSSKENFQELLDATHNAYRVGMPALIKPVVGMELLDRLMRTEPEPFQGWRSLLADTTERVARLPPGGDSSSVAEAYGPLSNYVHGAMDAIEKRLGRDGTQYKEALEKLLDSPPTQVAESMRTYFLVTFQRIVTGFKADSFRVLNKQDLPPGVADDIHKELHGRLRFLGTLQQSSKGYALAKLDSARKQLAVVLPILQREMRANLIPGGAMGMSYLVGALVTGILAEFVNPNVISPTATEGTGLRGGVVEATARIPIGILQVCLERLKTEGLNYTQDQIKEMLAKRAEAEKIAVFRRWETMTPEEKAINKRNQNLGLGVYAVGGTKAIYRLDEAQYERERGERAAMGMAEGFIEGAQMRAAMEQFHHEENYGGGGVGAEDGYEVGDGADFVD